MFGKGDLQADWGGSSLLETLVMAQLLGSHGVRLIMLVLHLRCPLKKLCTETIKEGIPNHLP